MLDCICYIINIIPLFDIPAADDKIFHMEATSQIWSYTNQDVYIGSVRLEIIILSLFFLLGMSNMRNHPKIVKFIFLLQWIYATVHLKRYPVSPLMYDCRVYGTFRKIFVSVAKLYRNFKVL